MAANVQEKKSFRLQKSTPRLMRMAVAEYCEVNARKFQQTSHSSCEFLALGKQARLTRMSFKM